MRKKTPNLQHQNLREKKTPNLKHQNLRGKKTRNSQHHFQHRGQHWTCAKTLIEAGARTKASVCFLIVD